MTESFREVFAALDNPSMKHAIFGHLPIALCMLLIPLTLAAALLRSNRTLRMVALIAFAILAIAAFLTVNTGEHAEAAINKILAPQVYERIERHEDMAVKLWLFGVGGLLLLGLAEISKKPGLRSLLLWLATLTAAASLGWVSLTAHHGGMLVYTWGVGTPKPVPCDEAPGSTPVAHNGSASQPHLESQPSAESDDARAAHFQQAVMPILSEHCFQCHNPAKVVARKSARLDLTSLETMLRGGVSGPAIVPQNPEESLLLKRVRHPDPEEVMPPDDPLTAEQIAALEQWIREGANWK